MVWLRLKTIFDTASVASKNGKSLQKWLKNDYLDLLVLVHYITRSVERFKIKPSRPQNVTLYVNN